jgi:hypothetical protein
MTLDTVDVGKARNHLKTGRTIISTGIMLKLEG